MSNKKMDDVFFLPLLADEDWVFQSDEEDGAIECAHEECAEAIALAVNNHDALVEALEQVAKWEISLEFRVNYGSNGERDYFRNLANLALQAIKGDQ